MRRCGRMSMGTPQRPAPCRHRMSCCRAGKHGPAANGGRPANDTDRPADAEAGGAGATDRHPAGTAAGTGWNAEHTAAGERAGSAKWERSGSGCADCSAGSGTKPAGTAAKSSDGGAGRSRAAAAVGAEHAAGSWAADAAAGADRTDCHTAGTPGGHGRERKTRTVDGTRH